MATQFQTAALGFLFWLVFGTGTLITVLIGQPLGIIAYALTGSDGIRDWVYRTGKATDQLCNAAFFGGNPKETISSHAGRWVLSGRDVPARFRLVRWITDKFEQNHVLFAIESPFMGEPL